MHCLISQGHTRTKCKQYQEKLHCREIKISREMEPDQEGCFARRPRDSDKDRFD